MSLHAGMGMDGCMVFISFMPSPSPVSGRCHSVCAWVGVPALPLVNVPMPMHIDWVRVHALFQPSKGGMRKLA